MPKADLPSGLTGPGHGSPLARTRAPGRSVSAREWVVDWWAGVGGALGSLLRFGAIPLEMGFRMLSGVWSRMYDGGLIPLQRAPIPVISVGNLTVGGSGKTPFSGWLMRGLRDRGEKPVLVARGYGEDEILLHRRWSPDLPVIAEEDRAFGAWKAAKKGATVVVLDDGFQHRRLARELDIVLVAGRTPPRVRLLPRGPFRETFRSLGRAGVVVLTQKGREEDTSDVEGRVDPFVREAPYRVAFVPAGFVDLAGKPTEGPGGEYLAVAGIGDPWSLFRVLRESVGPAGELLSYPDHHEYGWSDVRTIVDRAGGRTIVTTEKDAVKLEAFASEFDDLKVLRLGVEFLDGEDRLWKHIERVLKAKRTPETRR